MNRLAPAAPRGAVVDRRPAAPVGVGRPGWPLTALLVLYPLWWALGMGTLAVFLLAVPMALQLWRRRPVLVPPAGEYVADGAARQAAWVLAGGATPPDWAQPGLQRFDSVPTPGVRERYAEVRGRTDGQ